MTSRGVELVEAVRLDPLDAQSRRTTSRSDCRKPVGTRRRSPTTVRRFVSIKVRGSALQPRERARGRWSPRGGSRALRRSGTSQAGVAGSLSTTSPWRSPTSGGMTKPPVATAERSPSTRATFRRASISRRLLRARRSPRRGGQRAGRRPSRSTPRRRTLTTRWGTCSRKPAASTSRSGTTRRPSV